MVVRAQVVGDVTGSARELLQVLPDAEAAAGAGDHDRANGGILGPLERGEDPAVHGRVQRVEDLGAVERDRKDAALRA